MTTVWIVTQGDYSDYHIIGVFSTEENAKLIVSKIKCSDFESVPNIEPFELDPAVDSIRAGLTLYKVRMDLQGNLIEPVTETTRDIIPSDFTWCEGGSFNIYASDLAHATKIAAEKLTEYLARKAGMA